MQFIDACRLAIEAVSRSPLRAVLSVVSFSIGVAAPVFVFGISNGMRDQVAELSTEEFRRKVSIYQSWNPDSRFVPTSEDLTRLLNSSVPISVGGTFQSWRAQTAVINNATYEADVYGISDRALIATSQDVLVGRRQFTRFDNQYPPSCIISEALAGEIRNRSLPHQISVSGLSCAVVGVVGTEPYTGGERNVVYLPERAARGHFRGIAEQNNGRRLVLPQRSNDGVARIVLLFESYQHMEASLGAVRDLLNQSRPIPADRASESQILAYDFDEERYASAIRNMDTFLYSVMAVVISFIVLTVGLNAYYSIRERSDEIAVLFALGATPSELILIVAAETLFYVVAGGGIGIALAVPLAAPFAASTDLRITINGMVMLQAAGTLSAAGVAAAIIPAWNACRVDPSQALKSA